MLQPLLLQPVLFRFVDDSFSLYQMYDRQKMSLFQHFLDFLHPNIIFTTEIENKDPTNFLDYFIESFNNNTGPIFLPDSSLAWKKK